MLTNDIEAVKPGAGCYTAYLTAQGRMIADLWLYELGDLILLSLAGDLRATVMARLDQFIFSEDVQLGDVSDEFAQVGVVGPSAAQMVAELLDDAPPVPLATLPEHGNLRTRIAGSAAIVTRVTDTGEPGFDLYVERAQTGWLKDRLSAAGAPELDEESAEALRVEAGVPLFHRDMDEETIPLEAGIESRAISLTKGCYVGQEVIVRVLHRVYRRIQARKLVGLKIDGEAAGRRRVRDEAATVPPARSRPRPFARARRIDCARLRSARLHRAGHCCR